MQLLKKKKKRSKQQPGMGNGDVGMWAVTPPMNECIGVYLKNILTGHKLDQKFLNIWKKNNKKTPLTSSCECLGLNAVENQLMKQSKLGMFIIAEAALLWK